MLEYNQAPVFWHRYLLLLPQHEIHSELLRRHGKTLNPLKRKDKLHLTLLDTRGNKSTAGEPMTKTATPLDTEPQVLEGDGNLLT